MPVLGAQSAREAAQRSSQHQKRPFEEISRPGAPGGRCMNSYSTPSAAQLPSPRFQQPCLRRRTRRSRHCCFSFAGENDMCSRSLAAATGEQPVQVAAVDGSLEREGLGRRVHCCGWSCSRCEADQHPDKARVFPLQTSSLVFLYAAPPPAYLAASHKERDTSQYHLAST